MGNVLVPETPCRIRMPPCQPQPQRRRSASLRGRAVARRRCRVDRAASKQAAVGAVRGPHRSRASSTLAFRPSPKGSTAKTHDVTQVTARKSSLIDRHNNRGRPGGDGAVAPPKIVEVAILETHSGGIKQELIIEPRKSFYVGRSSECDYVVTSRHASAKHLRIYAHTTERDDVLVSCEDLSANGVVWNGIRLHKKSVILTHNDVIEIPKCLTFVYKHKRPDTTSQGKEIEPHRTGGTLFKIAGRYEVQTRVLGTGQFGCVFLAWDRCKQQQLACKRQPKGSASDSAWLLEEVGVLRSIKHPNINGLIDWWQDLDYVYSFFDIAAGGDLFSLVSQGGPLTDAEGVFVTYQMVSALCYLHSQGVAHLDIKPENVLVLTAASRFPHVQLADLGMAWVDDKHGEGATTEPRSRTDPLRFCPQPSLYRVRGEGMPRCASERGTVSYNPPEQLRCKATSEAFNPFLADSWALGVVVYILLTACHPFDSDAIVSEVDITPFVRAMIESGPPHRAAVSRYGHETDCQGHQRAEDGGGELPEGLSVAQQQAAAQFVRRVFTPWRLFEPDVRDHRLTDNAVAFIQGLLTVNPQERVKMPEALSTEWMHGREADLRLMYESRVLHRLPGRLNRRRDQGDC